jgi:hypothetical protein
MAKAQLKLLNKPIHEPIFKKTSIGGTPSSITKQGMNKHKRRSYKKYRGQGR